MVTSGGTNCGNVREYIDGAEYTYTNCQYSGVSQVKPDLIHFSDGYIQRDESTDFNYSWLGWVYKYALTDHLGNTRVVFSDKNDDGVVGVTDIEQINNYYPFGLNQDGPWNGVNGQYKFQYNQKEWNSDLGLNLNDYGARFYDPTIGRWHSIDPLSEKYFEQTQYAYASNNSIKLIDKNGKEAEYPIITITNQIVGSTDARVIGEVLEGNETTKINLYRAIVSDTEDPSFKMEFAVTRDAWVSTLSDAENDNVSNASFEPKNANINHYTAINAYKEYPKESGSGVGALKLTQYGSEVLNAAPRDVSVQLGFRKSSEIASGVMLHVGGYYTAKDGLHLAASEGCMGICNVNNSKSNPSNKYAAKVINTIINQAKKSESNPGKIEVILQPRVIQNKKKI